MSAYILSLVIFNYYRKMIETYSNNISGVYT